MNLLGIEIFNYAGLSKQYIPLSKRVQILAGRNNIGKSALLHALAAFSGSERFRAYAESSILELGFVFEAEPDEVPQDFGFLTDHYSTPKTLAGTYHIVTTFNKSGPSHPIKYLEVLPKGSSVWLELGELDGDYFHRTYYRFYSDRYHPQNSEKSHQITAYFINQFTAFLTNASYIDPHRKIEHGRQASEYIHLPTDGQMLPQFLLTLQGKDHKRFDNIERTFLACFPEYSKVLLPLSGNNISISLANRETDKEVPIIHCGTGVEQMLVLIASILGAREETTFLLDEPQDFLHPFLERRLMEIIRDSRHRFVIATHSATLINSVSADQVTLIEKPGQDFQSYDKPAAIREEILRTLGYRNSDLMFFEGAVFVEGKSDVEILPQLLAKAREDAPKILGDVCFCDLGGTSDYENFDSLREDLIVQEKLVRSLHRSRLPHMYIFDGDKGGASARIQQTKPTGDDLQFTFLERSEVENYLFDAGAITAAMNHERAERDSSDAVSEEDVHRYLSHLLALTRKDDPALFKKLYKTKGPIRSALKDIQGSRVLDATYSHFQMNYNKRRSGQLIAQFVKLDQDALSELARLMETIVSCLKIE
jgi:AAA domain, putative AbiEii toxin, Type IV TA system